MAITADFRAKLWLFLIVFLISGVIMLLLNYMVYKEMKNEERRKYEDHLFTILLTFILMTITTWLMVFGPRSGVFG